MQIPLKGRLEVSPDSTPSKKIEMVFIRAAGFLNRLKNHEIEEIHGAALQVLHEVGVMFESKDALQILEANGAEVRGSVAHIPEESTRECLRKTPSSESHP
ncbi:MAG: trimethylamine methyltransferase family protein [Thermoproteota archaeon]